MNWFPSNFGCGCLSSGSTDAYAHGIQNAEMQKTFVTSSLLYYTDTTTFITSKPCWKSERNTDFLCFISGVVGGGGGAHALSVTFHHLKSYSFCPQLLSSLLSIISYYLLFSFLILLDQLSIFFFWVLWCSSGIVMSSYFGSFQHFHDHISVKHDGKHSHTKFDRNWFMVAWIMGA